MIYFHKFPLKVIYWYFIDNTITRWCILTVCLDNLDRCCTLASIKTEWHNFKPFIFIIYLVWWTQCNNVKKANLRLNKSNLSWVCLFFPRIQYMNILLTEMLDLCINCNVHSKTFQKQLCRKKNPAEYQQ